MFKLQFNYNICVGDLLFNYFSIGVRYLVVYGEVLKYEVKVVCVS